jgi:hypothetical protein
MPTRGQVCAWIAGCGLVVPWLATAQDRTERDVVDLIVREGPEARAIRAGAEVTRREQEARLAYPNPAVTYSREGAGFTEFLQIEQSLPLFGVRDALSRAGVAAAGAAEAERDGRLWRAAGISPRRSFGQIMPTGVSPVAGGGRRVPAPFEIPQGGGGPGLISRYRLRARAEP